MNLEINDLNLIAAELSSHNINWRYDSGTYLIISEEHVPHARVFWDNQDCENEGWAWRIAYRYGGEESGPLNSLSDVQDLLNAITEDCDVD